MRKSIWILLIAVLAVAGGVMVSLSGICHDPPGPVAAPPAPAAGGGEAGGGGAGGGSGAGGGGAADAGARPRRDRTAAERLRRDIEAARKRREAAAATAAGGGGGGSGAGAGATGAPPEDPTLDKDYIRERVRELIPLLEECYTMALERDPKLAGTLKVTFVIAGEPDVGGVVESSEIVADGTTIADPEMLECVRETMYAAEFVAPAEGGTVTVTYPFAFASSEEEAAP